MHQNPENNHYEALKSLALSAFVICLLFAWQGNNGFNLWDEGFLWYGAQRVMVGEVPIRDFMAYDPGRYYWSAVLMSLFGDNGIMSLRTAVAVFQALGLFAGLILITQSIKGHSRASLLFLLISASILVMWMFPRHKLFDTSLSIFLIGTLTFLVQNPTAPRFFITGVCIGLVAVFGRNHGVYGIAGSLGVMAWLGLRPTEGHGLIKGFILWSAGVAAGFTPVLIMALVVPGFAAAFWENICLLFEQKATNLPVPVPWPWTVSFSALPSGDAVRGLLTGLFFMGILVFGALAVLWVVLRKLKAKPVPPALVAASFLAFPYVHYAYSRADVSHLAQGIFPFLIGCLVLFATLPPKLKWPLALALCAASLWVTQVFHPGWQCQMIKHCVNVEISGNDLLVDQRTADDIALLRQVAGQYAPNGQSFIVTPFWPGAYPLLERKSPIWEIYALFPRSEAFEKKEIERIKAEKPGFAFVFDWPLDGRDELRFINTHPSIHQYIIDNFDPLPKPSNPMYQIYKSRGLER